MWGDSARKGGFGFGSHFRTSSSSSSSSSSKRGGSLDPGKKGSTAAPHSSFLSSRRKSAPPTPAPAPRHVSFHVIVCVRAHRIERLPSPLLGRRLAVHLRRGEEGVQSGPARVSSPGLARLDESLRLRCTVSATAISSSASAPARLKYAPHAFALSVVDIDNHDARFGTHEFDITRLLPEYESGPPKPAPPSPEGWPRSFNLSGKAKGSCLTFTVGYELIHQESVQDKEIVSQIQSQSASSQDRARSDQPLLSAELSQFSIETNKKKADFLLSTELSGVPIRTQKSASSPLSSTELSGVPVEAIKTANSLPIRTQKLGDSLLPTELSRVSIEGKKTANFLPIITQKSADSLLPTELSRVSVESKKTVNSLPIRTQKSADHLLPTELLGLPIETKKTVNPLSSTELSGVPIKDLSGVPNETKKTVNSLFSTELLEVPIKATKTVDLGSFFDFQSGLKQYPEDMNRMEGKKRGELGSRLAIFNKMGGVVDDAPEDRHEAISNDSNLMPESSSPDWEDEADLVAGEFLQMLDSDTDTNNGPPKDLLSEQENDPIWDYGNDLELDSILEAAEMEMQKATQSVRSKTRAKMLEDAETEALMQQWGFNEHLFSSSNSPPKSSGRSSDLVVASKPPPLGPGLGTVLKMKGGGTLRAMNPGHFRNSRSSGRLVMQVSKPVVVPPGAGSNALGVLQSLAGLGVENMVQHAMEAMPLEDITGMKAEEIAASKGITEPKKPSHGGIYTFESNDSSSGARGSDLDLEGGDDSIEGLQDCVSLEDLAPLAMQNIEALAMDGLRIQSDMEEDLAPSYLDAAAWGVVDDLKAREGGGMGMIEGVASMPIPKKGVAKSDDSLEAKGARDLLSMAITLDEWTKLDAGVFDGDNLETKDRTLAILEAHNANYSDLAAIRSLEHSDRGRGKHGKHSKRWGVFGNTLMIALLVQLRDPLRNFEPVGAPMMALVQADRVMLPPRPRLTKRVSMSGNGEVADEAEETKNKNKNLSPNLNPNLNPNPNPIPDENKPKFKIAEVHVSGLKPSDEVVKGPEEESRKVTAWGSKKQQQSGSRWLVAHGMGKQSASSKHPLKSAKSVPSKTQVKPGDSLWSISTRVHGTGTKWQEVAALNPHIRNPDVIFPNQKIRIR